MLRITEAKGLSRVDRIGTCNRTSVSECFTSYMTGECYIRDCRQIFFEMVRQVARHRVQRCGRFCR